MYIAAILGRLGDKGVYVFASKAGKGFRDILVSLVRVGVMWISIEILSISQQKPPANVITVPSSSSSEEELERKKVIFLLSIVVCLCWYIYMHIAL